MINGGVFGVDVPVQLESNCTRLFLLNLGSERQGGQDNHLLQHMCSLAKWSTNLYQFTNLYITPLILEEKGKLCRAACK